MFFRLVRLLGLIVLTLGVTSDGYAKTYEKGVDYEIVSENITSTPEIREFYSFFCSHCFALRSSFDEIKKHFEGRAEFVDNPVGSIGGDIGVETQKGFAVALHQGIEKEYKELLFEKVHVNNEIPEDHEFFVDLFESIGLSRETFESDYNSFITAGKVAEFDRHMKDAKIEAVPELLINGKYLSKTDNIETNEDYIKLIEYLLTLK